MIWRRGALVVLAEMVVRGVVAPAEVVVRGVAVHAEDNKAAGVAMDATFTMPDSTTLSLRL